MDRAGETHRRISESTSRSISRGRSCGRRFSESASRSLSRGRSRSPRSSSRPRPGRSQSRGRSRHRRYETDEDESSTSSNADRLRSASRGRSLKHLFLSSGLGGSSNPRQVVQFQSDRDRHIGRNQKGDLHSRFLAETSRGGLQHQVRHRYRHQGIARFFSRRRIYEFWTLVRRPGRGR